MVYRAAAAALTVPPFDIAMAVAKVPFRGAGCLYNNCTAISAMYFFCGFCPGYSASAAERFDRAERQSDRFGDFAHGGTGRSESLDCVSLLICHVF